MKKIIYLRNTQGFYSGDIVQGELLEKHFNAMTVAPTAIQGKTPQLLKVDDVYYPVQSISRSLDTVEPDIVFIHTITPQLTQELPDIVRKYVTVWRLAINFEELFVAPQMHMLLKDFWNILRVVDCIICPSPHVESNLKAMGYENTVYVPTTVDLSKYPPTTTKESNVLSVGRLAPLKNTITALLAFKEVHRQIPTARMLIIGAGPFGQLYNQTIQGVGLAGVQLMGARPAHQFYSQSRIYVQSSFSENGSLSLLEAIASGIPSVASDIGGHTCYNTKSVLLAPHDNIKAFADKMVYLLQNEEVWERLHKQALKDAKRFDVSEVIPKYRKLFDKLVRLRSLKQ